MICPWGRWRYGGRGAPGTQGDGDMDTTTGVPGASSERDVHRPSRASRGVGERGAASLLSLLTHTSAANQAHQDEASHAQGFPRTRLPTHKASHAQGFPRTRPRTRLTFSLPSASAVLTSPSPSCSRTPKASHPRLGARTWLPTHAKRPRDGRRAAPLLRKIHLCGHAHSDRSDVTT
jgi:hypothetical protein